MSQYTIYPDGIDSSSQLPITIDSVTSVKAEVVNRLRDSTIAIESELGIQPSGTFTTVRSRLDSLDALIQTIVAGGGGTLSSVKKDGTIVRTQVTSINFVGAPTTVTASAIDGQVDVQISINPTQTLSDTLTLGNITGPNNIIISSGQAIKGAPGAFPGTLVLSGGAPSSGLGGAVNVTGTNAVSGAGGNVEITSGEGGGSNGDGGTIGIASGSGSGTGAGGPLMLLSGSGGATNASSGNVIITPGAKSGVGTQGVVQITGSGSAIRFDQLAAVPVAPGAGKGTVWLKNDATTSLYFTDSAGVDHLLSAGTFSAGGDLSGTASVQVVEKIHGATVPIAGALTTGNGLYVTGASVLSYSALNLAGGANFVTGLLPEGNQEDQTMLGDVNGTTGASIVTMLGDVTGTAGASVVTMLGDVTGTSGANTVTKLQNRNVASTTPTDGYVLTWVAAGNDWEPRLNTAINETWAAVLANGNVSGGNNPIVSDGYALVIGSTSTSTTGDIRVKSSFSLIGRDDADTTDISILGFSGGITTLKNGNGTNTSAVRLSSTGSLSAAGTTAITWSTTSIVISVPLLQMLATVTPIIEHGQSNTNDVTGPIFEIRAQRVAGGGGTITGGTLWCHGGNARGNSSPNNAIGGAGIFQGGTAEGLGLVTNIGGAGTFAGGDVTGSPVGGLGGNATLRGGNGPECGNATVSGGTPLDGYGGSIFVTATSGVGTNRDGGSISLTSGANTGTGTAGSLTLIAGNAEGTTGTPGVIALIGGTSNTTGVGGAVNITGGDGSNNTGSGGFVNISGGAAGNVSGNGGSGGGINILGTTASNSSTLGTSGGTITITAGASGSGAGVAGSVNITGGAGNASILGALAGNVTISGGPGSTTSTSVNAGSATIEGGVAAGDGYGGNVNILGGSGHTISGSARNGGSVLIEAGVASTAGGNDGNVYITLNTNNLSTPGVVGFYKNDGFTDSRYLTIDPSVSVDLIIGKDSGDTYIQYEDVPSASNTAGSFINITAQSANGDGYGGNIVLTPGTGSLDGYHGTVHVVNTGIVFDELSSIPEPQNNQGTLWVKEYSPNNTLYFTDELEQEHLLGYNINRIDSGNIGGSRLLDIDPNNLLNGTVVSVYSVGAEFEFVKYPDAQLLARIDGYTVVSSGLSVWVRKLSVGNPRFGAQQLWFIDPTLGNDDNDGYTSTTALKSADEWSRRLDGSTITADAVSVSCAAGTLGNFFGRIYINNTNVLTGCVITITGAKILSSTCTVSSVTAENPATQQEFWLIKTGGPTLVDNQRIRIITSATSGNPQAVGYIRGFKDGYVDQPYISTCSSETNFAVNYFPTAGDTFAIETLTSVFSAFDIEMRSIGVVGAHIEMIDMTQYNSTGAPGLTATSNFARVTPFGDHMFKRCIFDGTVLFRVDAPNFWFRGCEFKTLTYFSSFGSAGSPGHSAYQCVFRAGANVLGNGLTVVGTTFEGPLSLSGSGFSNSDHTLFSRISTGLMIAVGGKSTFVTNTQNVWTPPIGTRNGITVGINILPGGTLQSNNNTVFNQISTVTSTNRIVSVGRTISNYYNDEAEQSAWNCTDSANGIIFYDRSIDVAPSDNPILASYRYSRFGGHHGRSSNGSISSFIPAYNFDGTGGGAAAGHAHLSGAKISGGPLSTVNTATTNIVSANTMTDPGFSSAIDNAGFLAIGTLCGIDASNNVVNCRVTGSFKRIAGTLTAVGSTLTLFLHGDSALTTATANFTVSGASITLTATGVLESTIQWCGTIELHSTDFIG